jgi:hypothetical protein
MKDRLDHGREKIFGLEERSSSIQKYQRRHLLTVLFDIYFMQLVIPGLQQPTLKQALI